MVGARMCVADVVAVYILWKYTEDMRRCTSRNAGGGKEQKPSRNE